MGGLFSPAAFLTATRQARAQEKNLSLADMRLKVIPQTAAGAVLNRGGADGGAASDLTFTCQGLTLECGTWVGEGGAGGEGGDDDVVEGGRLAVSDDLSCVLPEMALIWEDMTGARSTAGEEGKLRTRTNAPPSSSPGPAAGRRASVEGVEEPKTIELPVYLNHTRDVFLFKMCLQSPPNVRICSMVKWLNGYSVIYI